MIAFATRSLLLALLAALVPAVAEAACPDTTGAFDFVPGGWVGQQFVIEEDGSRTFVGTTVWTARAVLDGCAFDERVYVHDETGEHVFTAHLLRSYDSAEERWELTEVDDRGLHLHFQGRRVDGSWGFEIPRVREGREYVLRLTWEQIGPNHVRERFERSYDDGRTFERVSVIEFYRTPELEPSVWR